MEHFAQQSALAGGAVIEVNSGYMLLRYFVSLLCK